MSHECRFHVINHIENHVMFSTSVRRDVYDPRRRFWILNVDCFGISSGVFDVAMVPPLKRQRITVRIRRVRGIQRHFRPRFHVIPGDVQSGIAVDNDLWRMDRFRK